MTRHGTTRFAEETGLSFDIRVVTLDKAPWFVAADVCRALGMNIKRGTRKWLAALCDDERNTHRLSVGIRGNPNVTLISESGLDKLIMRSDKPQARPVGRKPDGGAYVVPISY